MLKIRKVKIAYKESKMRIDFHTHSFPDALAPKAMETLKKVFISTVGIQPCTDGTSADAEKILRSVGVDKAIVCNIATNARQESKVNGYAVSLLDNSFFYPLGSVHPDSENIEEELDRLLAAGIRGIKLHPDYVGIELSDRRFDRIFSLLSERDMFTVVHTGYDPISPDKVHATPEMLCETVKKYNKLKLIAAHMGGFKKSEGVLRYLVGTNIYLDTSLSALRVGEWDNLYKILDTPDESRILFATDTPWSDPGREIEFIENAPISREKKEKIFSKNALELLKKK